MSSSHSLLPRCCRSHNEAESTEKLSGAEVRRPAPLCQTPGVLDKVNSSTWCGTWQIGYQWVGLTLYKVTRVARWSPLLVKSLRTKFIVTSIAKKDNAATDEDQAWHFLTSQVFNLILHTMTTLDEKQGGRSWQAFGKHKKCLQFFRRTRIC